MNVKDLSELDDDVPMIWVCGSRMPPEGDQRHAMAIWGECSTCRTKVVHSSEAPERATKLCLTCASIMQQAIGDGVECVMTPDAAKQIDAVYGPGAAERMHALAIRVLKGKA